MKKTFLSALKFLTLSLLTAFVVGCGGYNNNSSGGSTTTPPPVDPGPVDPVNPDIIPSKPSSDAFGGQYLSTDNKWVLFIDLDSDRPVIIHEPMSAAYSEDENYANPNTKRRMYYAPSIGDAVNNEPTLTVNSMVKIKLGEPTPMRTYTDTDVSITKTGEDTITVSIQGDDNLGEEVTFERQPLTAIEALAMCEKDDDTRTKWTVDEEGNFIVAVEQGFTTAGKVEPSNTDSNPNYYLDSDVDIDIGMGPFKVTARVYPVYIGKDLYLSASIIKNDGPESSGIDQWGGLSTVGQTACVQ